MKLNRDIYTSKTFHWQFCLNFVRPPCMVAITLYKHVFIIITYVLRSRGKDDEKSTPTIKGKRFSFCFAIVEDEISFDMHLDEYRSAFKDRKSYP